MVNEIRTAFGSLEETNRLLDVKVRLVPGLVEERFGWRPRTVSRVLIVPADDTLRRIASRHSATMDAAYPAARMGAGGRRRWMSNPGGENRLR